MSESENLLAQFARTAIPGIELGLERVTALLAALANPHVRLPPVIHVAGTNGKGSVVAMLTAIFQAAGKRVHRYISPHLVRFHERVMLGNAEISEPVLVECLRDVAAHSEKHAVTWFEATTAAAFLAFSRYPADILLLETGMGGRLDATNVIENPALTVITPISLDHCEFLGDTVEKIAFEKAGIMKQGVPCIIGKQSPEALEVLLNRAQMLGCETILYGRDFDENTLTAQPTLQGVHQLQNAATAVAAAQKMGVERNAIHQGIEQATWPARMQFLGEVCGHKIWLDGGHNPAAGQIVARWCESRAKKPHLIFGMIHNKDVDGFLHPLVGYIESITAINFNYSDSYSNDLLQEIANKQYNLVYKYDNWKSAIKELVRLGNSDKSDILICGSLYLAGQVLKEWPAWQPTQT